MSRSSELFEKSRALIPGGVNSPVRAFGGVGGDPVFFESADGAWLTDADGKQYVDYICSWGPMILGHRHPAVIEALRAQLDHGLGFGAPTPLELRMAEKICSLVPSMDQVRMVSSGTEATMSAIRLARGFTGRDRIIKFQGCYHGHADVLLVNAGSGALTFGTPSSPGVPAACAELTLTADFNDSGSVEALFQQYPDSVACVIVEPIAGNMNCIPPAEGFLQGLRDLCDRYQAVLMFDEVMTGFRVAPGGAQERYGVRPDMTALGKVIGGGLPVGAFGGRQEIMDCLAPDGPVYQAGTLSGNPVALTAGLTTLELATTTEVQQQLESYASRLSQGLQERADAAGIPFTTNQVGSMFGLFFSDAEQVSNYEQVCACDMQRFRQFFHAMLDGGVYLAPSAFEAGFVSAAHGDAELEHTLNAAEQAFTRLS